jgi:hypothetical protein
MQRSYGRLPPQLKPFSPRCEFGGYRVTTLDAEFRVVFLHHQLRTPNEPPIPGNVTGKQALLFAKALVRGQKDRFKIIRTVLEDKVREVV